LRKRLGAVTFAFALGGRDALVVAFMVFSGVVGVWLVVAFAFLLAVDRSRSWSSVRVRCRPFVFVVVRSCSLSSVRVRCHPFVFVVVRWRSRSFVLLVIRWCHQGGQEGGGGGFHLSWVVRALESWHGGGYSPGYFPSLVMGCLGSFVFVVLARRGAPSSSFSYSPSVPASTLCVRPHPSTRGEGEGQGGVSCPRGRSRGCSRCRFGRFRVRVWLSWFSASVRVRVWVAWRLHPVSWVSWQAAGWYSRRARSFPFVRRPSFPRVRRRFRGPCCLRVRRRRRGAEGGW
jgi:hypothetical protein